MRTCLETVPAAQYLSAVGMGLNLDHGENPDLVVQMLARNPVDAEIQISAVKLEQLPQEFLELLTRAAHGLPSPHSVPRPAVLVGQVFRGLGRRWPQPRPATIYRAMAIR